MYADAIFISEWTIRYSTFVVGWGTRRCCRGVGGEETRASIEDWPGWLLLARLGEVCFALSTAGGSRRIGKVEVYGFREEAIVKLISIVSNAAASRLWSSECLKMIIIRSMYEQFIEIDNEWVYKM